MASNPDFENHHVIKDTDDVTSFLHVDERLLGARIHLLNVDFLMSPACHNDVKRFDSELYCDD